MRAFVYWLGKHWQLIVGIVLVVASVLLSVFGGTPGLCMSSILGMVGGWLIGTYFGDRG